MSRTTSVARKPMFLSVMAPLTCAAMWVPRPGYAASEPADNTARLSRPMPITSPGFEPTITTSPAAPNMFHEPGLLFINFDGAQMQNCGGSNYAVENCSTIMNDEVLPYSGNETARAAVVQAMAADVAAFAVEVTDTRPPDDVNYDMVMVGNWNPPPDDGGFAGVAPTIDCYNTNRSETAFSLDLGDASTVAKVVGQEAAHIWGLEHVDSASDLLFPTTGGAANPSFEDICSQIVVLDGGIAPTTAACPQMHEINCPDQPDHQNSYQDMMMIFGPAQPDTVPPALEIISPSPGQEFASGAQVQLVFEMVDNLSPPLFTVYVGIGDAQRGDQVGTADYFGPRLSLPINGLPDGEHRVRVDVIDQDGNPATDVVAFFIGDPTSADETGSADAGGTETGQTQDSEGAGSDETGMPADMTGTPTTTSGGSSAPANATEADGCGCLVESKPTPTPLLGLLGFGMIARRRRAMG